MPKCNRAVVRNREGWGQTNSEALRRGGGSSITLEADLAAVSGWATAGTRKVAVLSDRVEVAAESREVRGAGLLGEGGRNRRDQSTDPSIASGIGEHPSLRLCCRGRGRPRLGTKPGFSWFPLGRCDSAECAALAEG